MTSHRSPLPKEVAALVHHVELSNSGWWDKTVERLVLAAIWMAGQPLLDSEARTRLEQDFQLTLGAVKLSSALNSLRVQGLLVQLSDTRYKIPEEGRLALEAEIKQTEAVQVDAKRLFQQICTVSCPLLDPAVVWKAFDAQFLMPLINEIGANAYRLLVGERLVVDSKLVDGFLKDFSAEHHDSLRKLIAEFLDPSRATVRAYVSRMLHARFCVEASGLPEGVIKTLQSSTGKQVRFRVFVDTNFLFSLLELHENPSNAAAKDLQSVIGKLKLNPKVELYITPETIDEAKGSIVAANLFAKGIPHSPNFTEAALRASPSGLVERFFLQRKRKNGVASADDWFDLYLNDFVQIARGKGVEIFNEKMDDYATRTDVATDIALMMKRQERKPQRLRKSPAAVQHDAVLWHFVSDRRPAYLESPADAGYWILTVDYGLIHFDEAKQKSARSKVPLCLHPSSLIQLLQFWVPRTQEFEEAMLGSLRLPFLFREFDADAEKMSLRILQGLGRFAASDAIPVETLTAVVLNEGLRGKLRESRSEEEATEFIRDALLDEQTAKAEAQISAKDEQIAVLKAQLAEAESVSASATTQAADSAAKVTELSQQVENLASDLQGEKDWREKLKTTGTYLCLLVAILVVSTFAGYISVRVLPGLVSVCGTDLASILSASFMFALCHLVLERCAGQQSRMAKLWMFRLMGEFRGLLWTIVVLGVGVGLYANLEANKAQRRLDERALPEPKNPATMPATRTGASTRDAASL